MQPVSIKPLSDVVGEAFARQLRADISFLDSNAVLISGLLIVVSHDRELRRDAALSLLNDTLGDLYTQRVAVISDHPEEIPARAPRDDAPLEEYTYAPALFSVAPGEANFPDAGLLDVLHGPQPSTTKLAKTIVDFSHWDVDAVLVLSPLETYAWHALVSMSLAGHITVAAIERAPDADVVIGKEVVEALEALGPNSLTTVDLDQQKIFKNLADANIVA